MSVKLCAAVELDVLFAVGSTQSSVFRPCDRPVRRGGGASSSSHWLSLLLRNSSLARIPRKLLVLGRSLQWVGCQKGPKVLGVPAGNEDGEGVVPLGQVGECLDCRLQSWPGKSWPWAALAIKCCHCHVETEVTWRLLWWLFLLHHPPLWHCDTRKKSHNHKNFM